MPRVGDDDSGESDPREARQIVMIAIATSCCRVTDCPTSRAARHRESQAARRRRPGLASGGDFDGDDRSCEAEPADRVTDQPSAVTAALDQAVPAAGQGVRVTALLQHEPEVDQGAEDQRQQQSARIGSLRRGPSDAVPYSSRCTVPRRLCSCRSTGRAGPPGPARAARKLRSGCRRRSPGARTPTTPDPASG